MPDQRPLFAGGYRLLRHIGTGPVGPVVEAERLRDGRRVALKSLGLHFDGVTPVVRRYARAIDDARRLDAAHAVRVFDVGGTTLPFVEMELLDAPSLAEWLSERGPLAVGDAVALAIQACDALSEAHALGFIHGNLKLENWFVEESTSGKNLKLSDFGTSRATLAAAAFAQADPDDQRLASGSIGMPHFVAPEQMTYPLASDPRSDVWAVGVALYTMLTGHSPFEARSVLELCASVMDGRAVPLARCHPNVPEGLAEIVDRALSPHPASRPQTIAELATALAPFADAANSSPKPRAGGEAAAQVRFTSTAPVAIDLNDRASDAPPKRRARLGTMASLAAAAFIVVGAAGAGSVASMGSPQQARRVPRTLVVSARSTVRTEMVVARSEVEVQGPRPLTAPRRTAVPLPSVYDLGY